MASNEPQPRGASVTIAGAMARQGGNLNHKMFNIKLMQLFSKIIDVERIGHFLIKSDHEGNMTIHKLFHFVCLSILIIPFLLVGCSHLGVSAIPTNTTPMSTSLPSVTSGSSTATIPMPPSQYIEIKSISDAQKDAKFRLMLPQFIPDNLQFSSGWVADYADGSEIIRLWYSEPGNPSDTGLKTLDIFQTLTDQPVTLQTILHQDKEIAIDVQEVQVREQSGFTYWVQSVAAGNSAHLAWREGGINYQLDLFGDWPAPNESNPHGLDHLLLQIAGSLQPIK